MQNVMQNGLWSSVMPTDVFNWRRPRTLRHLNRRGNIGKDLFLTHPSDIIFRNLVVYNFTKRFFRSPQCYKHKRERSFNFAAKQNL